MCFFEKSWMLNSASCNRGKPILTAVIAHITAPSQTLSPRGQLLKQQRDSRRVDISSATGAETRDIGRRAGALAAPQEQTQIQQLTTLPFSATQD